MYVSTVMHDFSSSRFVARKCQCACAEIVHLGSNMRPAAVASVVPDARSTAICRACRCRRGCASMRHAPANPPPSSRAPRLLANHVRRRADRHDRDPARHALERPAMALGFGLLPALASRSKQRRLCAELGASENRLRDRLAGLPSAMHGCRLRRVSTAPCLDAVEVCDAGFRLQAPDAGTGAAIPLPLRRSDWFRLRRTCLRQPHGALR